MCVVASLAFCWGQSQCLTLYAGTLSPAATNQSPQQAGEVAGQLGLVPHNVWDPLGIP